MGRGLEHLASHIKGFTKKLLKIPQILMKISKYSILDHVYFEAYESFQNREAV